MKISKRKITILTIMTFSLVAILSFLLVYHFRKVEGPSNPRTNLEYSSTNYVEINTSGNDFLEYEAIIDSGSGDTTGYKVVGFTDDFTTKVSKLTTELYSLTIPAYHDSKPVVEIAIPVKDGSGNIFSYPTVRPTDKPYETPWHANGIESTVGKVIVPKTVQKISPAAFNAFTEIREMELPFVGTERGNVKGSTYNKNTSSNCSFYAIFGTDEFAAMNDYNLNSITTGGKFNTLEEMIAARTATNDPDTYGTGQIKWRFNADNDTNSIFFNAPIHLTNVFITDEYCVADHAFFFSPSLKKIAIKWAEEVPSSQIMACGFGRRVFDTATALKMVILPDKLSSYGDGLFSHCLSLETVAVGGVETGEISYTELNSNYPKDGEGNFIKQVHLPLESPVGVVSGSDIKINEDTFEMCSSITNVVIPHNVTSIDAHAFDNCTSLINVRSSSKEYAVGNYCDLPQNLEKIGTLAFRNCTSLENITVPTNVKLIETAAFNRCTALKSLTLPFIGKERGNSGTVEALFGYVFGQYGNPEAGDTTASPDICTFQAVDGNPSESRLDPESAAVPRGQFYIPSSLKNVVISDESVVSSGAFMNCKSLVSLQITSFNEDEKGYSTMTIGEGALGGCINLENLSIPFVGPNEFMPAESNLNPTIRDGRGADTYQLGWIFGPYEYRNTTRIVQGEAFTSSNPKIYYFPSNLQTVQLSHQTYVPSYSFWKTAMIKNVIIDDKTKASQREIFHGCSNLENITVPFTGISRGLYTRNSGLMNSSTHWYGDYWYGDDYNLRNSLIWLFSNSSTDEHYKNAGITEWRDIYLGYIPMALKSVTITDETYFETHALNGFETLESVTINKGKNVDIAQMHIDEGILANCGKITNLELPFIGRDYNPKHENTKAYTIGWLFGNKYAYKNCRSVYQGVDGGATYQLPMDLKTISFDDYITTIADGAFRGISSLESVKSNAIISQLGKYAFANCSTLKEVVMPNATYSVMGDYAFANCVGLSEISAFSPNTVKKIGHGALMGTSIKDIDFSKYYYVGDHAFSNCLQLTSVDMTAAGSNSGNTTGYLDYVGKYLFSGCTRLTDVKLKDIVGDGSKTVQFVSDYMFEGCSSLQDINLNGKLASGVPNGFLKDCINLRSYYTVAASDGSGNMIDKGLVLYPSQKEVTRIGKEAFKGCKSLTTFILPENLVSIGDAAFQNCSGLDSMRIPRATTSIPLGTDANGVDNYKSGVFYGCDENKFYLEVFIPESKWPWGINWNCYFPVNIIGDQNENLFTYEYCKELKGYLITGLNFYDKTTNPTGVDFAPDNHLLLSGTLKFPSTYNGLKVYGMTPECFKGYLVQAYEGSNLVGRHPFAEVENFILGENFVTIGKDALNFDPVGRSTYRSVFSQKTAVQAGNLGAKNCSCFNDNPSLKHTGIAGVHYDSEEEYISNGIVYYKEAWTYTGAGTDSTPVYTINALKFTLDSTTFQYNLGKAIRPRIISIDVNDSYVKYPADNKDAFRRQGDDELYNLLYPDKATLDATFLAVEYINNINAGNARMELTSNNAKIKGKRTIGFTITKRRIDALNASMPDANYYGSADGVTPLSAQDHLEAMFSLGKDNYQAYYKNILTVPASINVSIAHKTYDGKPWENKLWTVGTNLFGLPDGFSFSGTLQTNRDDAGHYWTDANVVQSQHLGENDFYHTIDVDNPDLWIRIQYMDGFKWSSKPVIKDSNGRNVTKNFEVVVTGAVYIEPHQITEAELKWPGVYNGSYHEIEYTGLEIIPVPTVVNGDGITLDPEFKVRVSSEYKDPDHAIDPSETLYRSRIIACNTRNFVFVTYDYAQNKNLNYIDFKVVKARLTITMDVVDYLIGVNDLEFSFDLANWVAYKDKYHINIKGLGYGSSLGGTIHTTSSTAHGGWENQSVAIYSSDGTDYKVEWSNSQPFVVTNADHDPVDITSFYEPILDVRVGIEWNRFDYDYTITDPTLSSPYVIKGVDKGMGIEVFEETPDMLNMRYGVDGYEHTLDIIINNVGISQTIGDANFNKTFTYDLGSGAQQFSSYTIQNIINDTIKLDLSRDRFYPITQTINLSTVKGSYVVKNLTKEYDRQAVDPYANLVRKPKDFDPTKLIFVFYNRSDRTYAEPLGYAPSAIGNYKYTMSTLDGHSTWFNDEDEWPRKEVNKNQADFDITRRSIYIHVVDNIPPIDSKLYDGEPWKFEATNTTNVTGMVENLLEGDLLTGRFMSRDKEIGTYDGGRNGDFIIATAMPWSVSNSKLGDQSDNYRIVFKGVYEIKPKKLDWKVEGVDTVYDGQYYTPTVTVNDPTYGYTIYYSETPSVTLESGDWSIYPPYKVEPGEYTIWVKVEAPYYESEMNSCVIKIKGKNIQCNIADQTVPYDGYEHGIDVEVTDPEYNYTIYYAILEDEMLDYNNVDPEKLNFRTVCPLFEEAGIYHYWVKVEAPNYQSTEITHVTLTIDNNIGTPQNIAIQDYVDFFDGKYHGPMFDLTNMDPNLKPEDLDISYYFGDGTVTEPKWYSGSLELVSGSMYHLPILHNATDDPVMVTVRSKVLGYALTQTTVGVYIKKLQLHLEPVSYVGIFDNKYHTVYLQAIADSGHTLEILEEDVQAKVPFIKYRYYFGTDKETAQYVDLEVRYSATPAISGNTSGFVSTPVRYINSRKTPYQIFINVSAPNCKDTYLHTGTVTISFNNNPTWSLKEEPVEIEYLARPVTLADMQFETVHDGQPILTYYAKANPSVPIAAPIDLGEYWVEAVYPATSNCAKMEARVDFTIVPRRLIINYEKEHEYSGVEWVPEVFATTNTTDTVLIHPYLEAGSNGIDLGDHYFYIEMEVENKNYYIAPEDQRLMFTIIKRKLVVTFPDENGTKIHQYSIPPSKWTGTEADLKFDNLLPSDRVEMVMETTGTAARRYTTNGTFTYDGGDYLSNWTGSNLSSNAVKVLILDIYHLDEGGSVVPATYYDVEVHLTVRIALPKLDVTVDDPTEYNYDNTYHTLDITMNTRILNYTTKYWPLTEEEYNKLEDFDTLEDREGAVDTFMQSEAGIYYVAYEINASNYDPYRGKARLIINKVALDIELKPFEQIYDAQKHQVEFDILNLEGIPTYPTAKHYYFSKKLMDERRITIDDIRKFFEDGCPTSSKKIYELWNAYTKNQMEDAGEYVAVILYDETLNWNRSFAIGEVEIQKRPLYFNYNGDNIYTDYKIYDGDKLIMPSMALLSYDESDTSGNKLPYSGLVKNHQILSTRMGTYSLRTSSADCRGDSYADIPDLDPVTRALWESPYQDKGDFEFHFFQVFYGASPTSVNTTGTNYADNYYPVVNKKNDVFQVQLTIKRAQMTRFEVTDNEYVYNGKDAMPTIRTHANGIGDFVYYYYPTDDSKNLLSTTPMAHATDVNDGYYQIYISVKPGRNYYQWNGESDSDPNNGAAVLGSDYMGYRYKMAYVKVIPAEVRINWNQLEGYFDADENGNVLNHDPQPSFTTVTGRTEYMEYDITDSNGNPVYELKRAGSYGLSAHLAAYSDIVLKNYTFENADVTYTIKKRSYTISEVINDVWLHTNWTKTYTEDYFDTLTPEELPWLTNFKLELVVRANANTAGQLYTSSQFTSTPKVTFVDPVSGDETDYTDCFQFNLDLLVNLTSNDLIVEGNDIDVVYDNTYHYPDIQVLSYANGYIISYYVMLVQEDGSYFNDWSIDDNPEKITYSEHLTEQITYGGKTYRTFFDTARYRVFYRVTIGATSESGTDDIVYGNVDVHIRQAHPTLDFGNTGLDRVYNGIAPQLSELQSGISGHFNGRADQLQFTYYELGSTTPLSKAPIDVGEYVVVVTSLADDDETIVKNYAPLNESYNFEITPRVMTLTANTDWEVDQSMLDDTSLMWSSKENDNIYELANTSTGITKYSVDVTNTTGLCSSDVLTFEIKAVNHIANRGRYFLKSSQTYDNNFTFDTYDPVETFSVTWSVRYDDKGSGIVGNPDKTRNYVLKIDFNLVVHFPYIEVKVQDKTYAYDGSPKDLLGAGKNIEIIRPNVSDCTILYGERNNAITDTTYERTEPGSYYAYFTIASAGYETFTGTTTLNINYQTRDDNLTINGTLSKVYDDVAYDSTTRPDVSWTVSPGEALPDPSTWKIEYFAAFKDGSLNYFKTGDAMESVINAGDYIYRLTIPAGTLFSETVIERPFTITRRTYVITAPDPSTPIIKSYDGKPWQYNLGSSANPDGFTFEPVPGYTVSGLVPGHRLLAGTLITTGADARTYSSVKTDQYRVQLQVNEPNDYMIVDTSGRDIDEDNYAVEYNMEVIIEKGIMTVETNVDANNQIPYSTEGFTFRAELKVPNGYQSKVMYSKDGTTFSAECPKFYNLGTNYQVIVKVEGIPNYYDFQRAYLFDIVQQQNILNIDIKSRPYNGFAMDTPLIKTLDYQGYATSAPTPGVKVQWYNATTGQELTSAPKDVGQYQVKVTYPTNSKYLGVSKTENFEITPLEISVSWTDTELIYSASAQYPTLHLSATNNATDNMQEGVDYTLTYTYNDMTAITTPIAGKPFDVGSYIVKFALVPGTKNYVLSDGSLEAVEYFVIKQRHITISFNGKFDGVSDPNVLLDQSNGLKVTGLPANVLFIGGLKTTKNISGSYNVIGTYPMGSSFDNLYTWSNTIAGRNKPYIEFKSGAPVTGESDLKNYVIELNINMSITNGSLPYTVTPVDVDYDDKLHSLEFKLNYDPAVPYTIEYSLDNMNWRTEPYQFKDVVDQHIFVRVKTVEYGETLLGQVGDADYDQFNVKIKPLKTTLTKPNGLVLDKVYDDKDVVVDGIIYNGPSSVNRSGDLTYTFYQYDEENANWVEQPFARYAGEYKVIVGMKTTQNFIGTEGKNVGDPDGPIEIEFTISKREVNLNIGTATKVYDGEPWYGRVSNIPGDVTPDYTVSAVPGNPNSGLIANHYLKVGLYTNGSDEKTYTASRLNQPDSDFILANEFEVRCDSAVSVDVDRVKSSYELLVNADVHITQAEFDVEVEGHEGPYDGNIYKVRVIWKKTPLCPYEKLDDLVFFRYAEDGIGDYVDDDPGTTKTSSVWVKLEGKNYKTKYIHTRIVLHPQDTTITITDWEGKTAGQDKIYDGLPYDESSIKVTLPKGDTRTVTFKYYDMDNGGVELPSAPINAGNYRFVAHVDASDDGAFSAADSSPVSFRIAPQTVTVTWKPDKLVKDTNDNKDYYILTFNGKSNMPTPSAIGKINDPVEDDTIDLEVELLTPAGVTDAISIGTYSCKAKIKDVQDQKNYVLQNDTVNFKIERQPGGIIVPGGDIPQPGDDGYSIGFISPFKDPEANQDLYDYKKLMNQGKFYAEVMIKSNEKTVILILTVDLKTGEVIGIHKNNLSGDPVGMVGDGLAADTEVSFTLEVPVQRDKDGNPILDKDGNRIPIITTEDTPVTAILKDKLNMAWDSFGSTADLSYTLKVKKTGLSDTPVGPENYPEIEVRQDYDNVHLYTGSEITFPITVAVTQGTADPNDDIILVEGVDYEIEWLNNIQPSKDGKMGSFVVTNTATGGYEFTIGDSSTETHTDDAGQFTIIESTPERLTLSDATLYKFEYIEQNFTDLTYSTKIYTNKERTALYDDKTIEQVAAMPLRLGHVYQNQTIDHLLRQFINSEDDIVIYSSNPTITTPIFDKKDPNCDIEAAKKTIITTGMKVVLYENGQAHDNAHQRDSIEVLLKGDVNGDGLININDITTVSDYIKNLKVMLNDTTDNTEYSALYQAALLTGKSSSANINDITIISQHITGAKVGSNDINDAYNPNKVTPPSP